MTSTGYPGNQPSSLDSGGYYLPVQALENPDTQNRLNSQQSLTQPTQDAVSFSGNQSNVSKGFFQKYFPVLYKEKAKPVPRQKDSNKLLQWIIGIGSTITLLGIGGAIGHHQKWINFGKIGKKIKTFFGIKKTSTQTPAQTSQNSTGTITSTNLSPQKPKPITINELMDLDAESTVDEAKIKDAITRCDDINAVNEDGETALSVFSYKKYSLELLQYLLAHGADAKTIPDNQHPTALQVAASHSLEKTRLLLENGASPNEKRYGQHPLHLALWNDKPEIVKYLLDHGAKKDVVDEDGLSLLHYASSSARTVNHATIQALLDAGIEVDITGNDNLTPLLVSKNMAVADYLIQKGANTQHVSATGKTLFHTYAEIGTKKDVDTLLQKGFDLNACAGRKTALSFAIENKNSEVARFLIQKGIEYTDQDLVAIASKGDTTTFTLLMQDQTRFQKVMKEAQDSNALKPLWFMSVERALGAKDDKRQEALNFINHCLVPNRQFLAIDACHGHQVMDAEGSRTALFDALTQGDNELTELLLRNGANANIKNSVAASSKLMHQSPLYLAVKNNNKQACELLLQHGADCNMLVDNYSGRGTVLSEAVGLDSPELLNLLLENGTIKDLNVGTCVDSSNRRELQSPLYIAVARGKLEFVQALLKAGADPTIGMQRTQHKTKTAEPETSRRQGKDKEEQTPLEQAKELLANAKSQPERENYQKIIELLAR